ncbi:MAG: hypothetical protein WC423_15905 [Vulcanimicrobiota bacterium]
MSILSFNQLNTGLAVIGSLSAGWECPGMTTSASLAEIGDIEEMVGVGE